MVHEIEIVKKRLIILSLQLRQEDQWVVNLSKNQSCLREELEKSIFLLLTFTAWGDKDGGGYTLAGA